jgi:phenylpropionate dioxygenase-like ring-hydroxylating dioxygenase large terminal subunit
MDGRARLGDHPAVTAPDPATLARARAAMATMADRTTPLLRDEWYCAGLGHEFGAHLVARTLLGDAVVFHRASTGEVVALEDRCAHRSYPLSQGRLDGDTLVCGYHGFCYDTRGDCVRVPSQPAPPRRVGVRRYPTVEQGRVVWIWMGEPARAEGTRPPLEPWMLDPAWQSCTGYLHLPASYVALHENLLDLTHIEYLHAATLGQGAQGMAAAPYAATVDGAAIAIERRVEPASLPPVFAATTGLGDVATAVRVSRTDCLSPALEQVTATYFDGSLPEASRRAFQVRTAHLLTPETNTTTHYFVDHAWNWPIDDPALLATMHRGLFDAFEEDVRGLALVERTLAARADDPAFHEVSVASDVAGVALRRLLKKRADAEAARRTPCPSTPA